MKAGITTRTIAVLVCTGLLPIIALTLFTPFYQTNDDIAMRLLAEGNFVPGSQPVPFLMFMNIAAGKLLALAYGLAPAIPWYDLFLGASLTAAAAALVSSWMGEAKPLEIAWTAVFALLFLLPAFVAVQFSLAGMGCAAAGAALMIRAGVEPAEPHASRRRLQIGIALFVLGSVIRFEGAVLIAIETAALAIPLIAGRWRDRPARPQMGRAMFAFVAAAMIAAVLFGVNQVAYRLNTGWKDFYEYNLLRSRLGEYLAPERLTADAAIEIAKEVEWSPTDFALFRNWFFTDPDVYSLDRVRTAERLFYGAAAKPTDEDRRTRLARGLALGRSLIADTRWAFMLMGAFVLARGVRRPKLILYFVWVVVVLVLLIVGISLALKAPPQRIFWPMLILSATMLTIAAHEWGVPAPASIELAALAVAICVTVTALLPLHKESNGRREAAATARRDVAGLRQTGATLFVLHANAFPYEDYWRPLHSDRASFDFVGLGASARTPPVQDFLRTTGRTDLAWSLCSDPSVLLIASEHLPPMLTTFVAEHRGVSVRFEEVFHGQRVTAWKCRR
jgi:hypothetical protein